MITKLFALALGGVFALGTTAVLAQYTTPTQTSPEQSKEQTKASTKKMDPDQQLQRLADKLNLTALQQSQIRPILEEQQQRMRTLSLDRSISQSDRSSQTKSITSDSNSRIEAVLNDDQKQKFQAMQEKKREKKGITGPGETPPSATSPASTQPQSPQQ